MQDLNSDSQLVFQESPGSRLVKQLEQKLTAALAKHDAAHSTCQTLEETAQQLREHQQSHDSQAGHPCCNKILPDCNGSGSCIKAL